VKETAVNKWQVLVVAIAGALVVAVSSAARAQSASAVGSSYASSTSAPRALRPSDEGPIGTTRDPLETWDRVEVGLAGRGRGTVVGSGFDCPQKCVISFKRGQRVELWARTVAGSRFDRWVGACGAASRSLSCSFKAGDVRRVVAVFEPVSETQLVTVSEATLSVKSNDGILMRRFDVTYDVAAPSSVTYELAQGGSLLKTWNGSPFSGRSRRGIWIDNQLAAGSYLLTLRVKTGTQVKAFAYTLQLPEPPQ
jgi:hypothetical protein